MKTCDVAIIGAGPYGLSLAAHLKARGVNFRVFGNPMNTWRTQMPEGMKLKSEGFASSLDDIDSAFTMEAYCKEKGLPFEKLGLPVPLEQFIAYGLEFQKRFVPNLENQNVVSVRRAAGGFEVGLGNGETFIARRVVSAVGITHFSYIPDDLAALPAGYVSHSSEHSSLENLRGREIAIVGGGSSAADLAGLLQMRGISSHIIARGEKIRFHDKAPNPRPLLQRIQRPMTGIGPGWHLVFCSQAPLWFHKMPLSYRLNTVKKLLGPAPGWFVREQVEGKVPVHLLTTVTSAKVENGRVVLQLVNKAGKQSTLVADHVVAATGYRTDLKRLKFLGPEMLSAIRQVVNTPILKTNFESSIPGLYFVGVAAANSFGPLLRFADGARFTARHLGAHLAKTASNTPAAREVLQKEEAVERDEVYSR